MIMATSSSLKYKEQDVYSVCHFLNVSVYLTSLLREKAVRPSSLDS